MAVDEVFLLTQHLPYLRNDFTILQGVSSEVAQIISVDKIGRRGYLG